MNLDPTTAGAAANLRARSDAHTRLRGRWLVLAWGVWLAVVVLAVGLFAAAIPARYGQLLSVSPEAVTRVGQLRPEDAGALAQLGLSPRFYAAYLVTLEVVTALVFVAVAVVIVWRKSDDWMALFVSLMLVLFGVTLFPPVLALGTVHPAWQLPVRFLRGLALGCMIIFWYLFPDGQFIPRWTRWLAVVWGAYILLGLLVPALDPLVGLLVVETQSDVLVTGWFLGFFGTGALAQIYRYRRVSGPIQRQQTKWLVLEVVFLALIGLALVLLGSALHRQPGIPSTLYILAAIPVLLGAVCLLPTSIGIAILRYRLWDVDPIINRTLVYGTLTALLALLYWGSVVLLQQLFRPFVGGGNNLAIVASTLAIYALFQPLRRRIQAVIDRRFYRRKYDAAHTLAAFSAKIRNEVDLETVTNDLLAVVEETIQPTHVSLWLRDLSAPRQPEG